MPVPATSGGPIVVSNCLHDPPEAPCGNTEKDKHMRRRRLTSGLIASVVACTGVLATASASEAARPVCDMTLGYVGRAKVPSVNIPYAAPGVHLTDCYMKQNVGGGAAIRALQESLAYCHKQPGISVDGVFGAKTRAALLQVQRNLAIEPDGIYGNESRDHMLFFVGWVGSQAACDRDPYYPNDDIKYSADS